MSQERKSIRTVWIFDFDGTLSEIVPDRHKAVLHPECKRMLSRLSQDSAGEVVILSSRTLEDLIRRIPFKKITLMASSGLEIRLSDGQIKLPETRVFRQAIDARKTLLPAIASLLGAVEGVDLEDKMWSITVHYRNVPASSRPKIRTLLAALRAIPDIKLFAGPEAMEITLLPQVDKSKGVRRLLEQWRIESKMTGIVYAGDDQNDAKAMNWILSRSGAAIVVGNRIKVKGAAVVQGPAELATKIMELQTSRKQEQLFRL
jgi:trehalose-phosphatase